MLRQQYKFRHGKHCYYVSFRHICVTIMLCGLPGSVSSSSGQLFSTETIRLLTVLTRDLKTIRWLVGRSTPSSTLHTNNSSQGCSEQCHNTFHSAGKVWSVPSSTAILAICTQMPQPSHGNWLIELGLLLLPGPVQYQCNSSLVFSPTEFTRILCRSTWKRRKSRLCSTSRATRLTSTNRTSTSAKAGFSEPTTGCMSLQSPASSHSGPLPLTVYSRYQDKDTMSRINTSLEHYSLHGLSTSWYQNPSWHWLSAIRDGTDIVHTSTTTSLARSTRNYKDDIYHISK